MGGKWEKGGNVTDISSISTGTVLVRWCFVASGCVELYWKGCDPAVALKDVVLRYAPLGLLHPRVFVSPLNLSPSHHFISTSPYQVHQELQYGSRVIHSE